MQEIVDNFNAEHPDINVKFWTSAWTNVFTKFQTSFATGDPPDVLIVHVTDIPQFASRKMLQPLAERLEKIGIKPDEYFARMWESTFHEGAQYAVPLDFHSMAIYCNVELFEKAGVDPHHVFTDREDFIETAKKLVVKDDKGEITQYGIAIGSTHAHTARYWHGLLYQNGGELLTSDNKKAAFNSQAGIEAYQFLVDLVYKHKVAPEQQFDIDRDFLSGKTAMVIEGPWWVPSASEQLDYVTVPFPQIFGRKGVWANSHCITLPGRGDEDRQNAALTLIKYISDNSFNWGKLGGQIPAKKSVVESAEYQGLENYLRFKTFIDEADYVYYEPILIQTAQIGYDNSMSPLITAMEDIMLQKKSPKDALDEAAAAIDKILAK
jgi:multiple sugar transport system substrate-binding protein